MLRRALKAIENGFYIDVGANLPEAESVTKAFYDRGWSGINIEPTDYPFEQLQASRPRDINLKTACWKEAGEAPLFLITESEAFATLNPDMAALHKESGREVISQSLTTTTLRDVCSTYVKDRDIHFLKVDVEGGELAVFEGADFTRWRPWIIIGEAHGPDPMVNFYQPWEDLLCKANYCFVYSDGLNRFFVAKEHEELRNAFLVPPNVYDNFITASAFKLLERAETAERQALDLARELEALQKAAAAAAANKNRWWNIFS